MSLGSYYEMPNDGMYPGFYMNLPAGTPGWQDAPVPGWGINPMRAGPRRVGVGEFPMYSDDVPWNSAVLPRYASIGLAANDPAWGYIAGAGAGGIVVGLTFGWLWGQRKKR